MAVNTTVLYLASFFSMYVILTAAVFIRFRGMMMDEFRKKFLIKKGYGYVRIHGNDKRVQEHFMKLTEGQVTVGKGIYFTRPSKVKFKGIVPVYDFRKDIAEPIDVYSENMTGTDPNFLDAWMFKMKSLAKVTAAKEYQTLLYVAGAAAIAAGIAAVICYTNYNTLQDMARFIIK